MMTIKTITLEYGDYDIWVSKIFIVLKDFDPEKELINFKKENKHEDRLLCIEFVDYLLDNALISKLPYNKTFVVSNDFYINNELHVG